MQSKVNFATLGVPLSLALLVVWAVATFVYEAPGWVHLLLIAGVFLLIYAIVVRGTPAPAPVTPQTPDARKA